MRTLNLMSNVTLLGTVFAISAACVTVHVNFPESSVQKATDDYVREIYKSKNSKKQDEETPAAKPSSGSSSLIDLLIPSAHAVEVDATFRTDTANAKQIQSRQARRLDEIDAQKRAGVIGETAAGTLVVKSPDKLKKLLQAKVERVIAEENADREALYKEVLETNKMASNRLKDIQASFARSFQKASPAGTWIEDESGSWKQK
jgi:uncharacterized protein